MHMASKCVHDEGNAHPSERFVCGVINILLHPNLPSPAAMGLKGASQAMDQREAHPAALAVLQAPSTAPLTTQMCLL